MTSTADDSPRQGAAYKRVSYYISVEVDQAFREALYWTRDKEGGQEQLSWLVEDAMWDKIRELRDRHNQGRPFPPAPARPRRGRPITR